jgi:hypothetical protein
MTALKTWQCLLMAIFILLMKTGALICKYISCVSCIMHTDCTKELAVFIDGNLYFHHVQQFFSQLLSCWTCNLFFLYPPPPACLFIFSFPCIISELCYASFIRLPTPTVWTASSSEVYASLLQLFHSLRPLCGCGNAIDYLKLQTTDFVWEKASSVYTLF